MNAQAVHPPTSHHVSGKAVAAAVAGAALAVAAGFGIATVVLDEPAAPPAPDSRLVPSDGTDRLDRQLMHRLG